MVLVQTHQIAQTLYLLKGFQMSCGKKACGAKKAAVKKPAKKAAAKKK